MTSRLSLPTSLPGPCPVCGEQIIDGDGDYRNIGEHMGCVRGYNRAIADVVKTLQLWDQIRMPCASIATLIERGDAFGAGRRRP